MKIPGISALFTIALASLVLTSPLAADGRAIERLDAYAAYKAGDHEKARKLWSALAERGDTTAMNNLANMFDQGQGSKEDPATAAHWLRKAARQGDRMAQLNLGLAYEMGRGVPRDNHEAAYWFRQAAEQGVPEAQFNLGVMLATAYGKGGQASSAADRQAATQWLSKAAAGGHPEAPEFLKLLQP